MLAIAPTDQDWFDLLRERPGFRLVNFWTPTPWGVRGLRGGDRLYFMLKAPVRKIGGFGYFERYEDSTASGSWRAFGESNGVASLEELLVRTRYYAARHSVHFDTVPDPTIGNIVLRDPVFFDPEAWFTAEAAGVAFAPTVVKLKYFPNLIQIGPEPPNIPAGGGFELVGEGASDYVKGRRKRRRGQAAFRSAVLKAYGHRCALSEEDLPELLEAAHIEPYVDDRSDHLQNGICLRVDLHRLFDGGLLTIDSGRIAVAPQLARSDYASLQGRTVRLPGAIGAMPSSAALARHKAVVFRG